MHARVQEACGGGGGVPCLQPFLLAPGAWGGLPLFPSYTHSDLIWYQQNCRMSLLLVLRSSPTCSFPPNRGKRGFSRFADPPTSNPPGEKAFGEGWGGRERNSQVNPTSRAGKTYTRQCGTFRHPSATATPSAGRRQGRKRASQPRTCPCGLRSPPRSPALLLAAAGAAWPRIGRGAGGGSLPRGRWSWAAAGNRTEPCRRLLRLCVPARAAGDFCRCCSALCSTRRF